MEPTIESTDSVREFNDEFNVEFIKIEPSHQFDEDNNDSFVEDDEIDLIQMKVDVKEEPEIHIIDVQPNDADDNCSERQIKSKRFKCKYCDKTFHQQLPASIHERIHTGEKPFACDKCPLRFAHRSNLKRHMLIHSGVKPFECEMCSMRFTTKYDLNKHIACIHSDETPFTCQFCSKYFKHKRYLAKHIKQHENESGFDKMGFVCDECPMTFAFGYTLKRHKLIHLNVKPFECKVCSRRFSSKDSLNRHMTTVHNDKKPFTCHICPQSFKLERCLMTHIQRHKSNAIFSHQNNTESTSYGLFICNLCQNSYATRKGLIVHMRYHSKNYKKLQSN